MQQRTTRFNPNPALGASGMPHQMPLPQMQYPQNPYFDYMAAAQFYASMYGYTPEQTAQMYMQGYGAAPTPYQYGAWPGMLGAGVGTAGATTSVPVPVAGGGNTIVVYNLPDDASRPVVLNLLKSYGAYMSKLNCEAHGIYHPVYSCVSSTACVHRSHGQHPDFDGPEQQEFQVRHGHLLQPCLCDQGSAGSEPDQAW